MELENRLLRACREGNLGRELVRLGLWPQCFLEFPEDYGFYTCDSPFDERIRYLDISGPCEEAYNGEYLRSSSLESGCWVTDSFTSDGNLILHGKGTNRHGPAWNIICDFTEMSLKRIKASDS